MRQRQTKGARAKTALREPVKGARATVRQDIAALFPDQLIQRPLKRFYSFTYGGTSSADYRIDYSENVVGSCVELIEVSIPIFDNICDEFSTNTIEWTDMGGPGVADLDTGCYTNGTDLATELTAKTSMTWTFNTETKRMEITHTGNFTLQGSSRLVQQILGFNDYNAVLPVTSLVANDIINLMPYSHYLIDSNKMPTNTILPGGKSCSIALSLNTFDLVTSHKVRFDVDDYYRKAFQFSGSLFPMELQFRVLFLDGGVNKVPLKDNLKVTMTIGVSGGRKG